MPIASTAGTAKRNIMIVPCIVKSWLYVSGRRRSFAGTASWVRMRRARMPASTKKRNAAET
jgi:hypothetical protein